MKNTLLTLARLLHPNLPPFTIGHVIESYLIQQRCMQRRPRGRIATLTAYRHLGIAPPDTDGGLLDPDV